MATYHYFTLRGVGTSTDNNNGGDGSIDEYLRLVENAYNIELLDKEVLARRSGCITHIHVLDAEGLQAELVISDSAEVSVDDVDLSIGVGTARACCVADFLEGHYDKLVQASSYYSGEAKVKFDAVLSRLQTMLEDGGFEITVDDCFDRSFVAPNQSGVKVVRREYRRPRWQDAHWNVPRRAAKSAQPTAKAPTAASAPRTSPPTSGQLLTRTGLVFDPRMMLHEAETFHPEQPARISFIWQRLEDEGLVDRCVRIPARSVTKAELSTCHNDDYVDYADVFGTLTGAELVEEASSYNSIYLNEHSLLAAQLSCGSVVELASRVAAGELDNGFAVVRPPGHHAEPDKAMGFCLFNNVAAAAGSVIANGLAKRVVIVDWDVHHGNGTQRMFEERDDVLYVSLHRYDDAKFYPCSPYAGPESVGSGAGEGYSVNVGWNTGPRPATAAQPAAPAFSGAQQSGVRERIGDADYVAAFNRVVLPVCAAFGPDLVLVSAGFDAAIGDPLGGCAVSPAGYAYMTHALAGLAGGRVAVALEGGYNLSSIAASAEAVVRVLTGGRPPMFDPPLAPRCSTAGAEAIAASVAALSPYWPCLGV